MGSASYSTYASDARIARCLKDTAVLRYRGIQLCLGRMPMLDGYDYVHANRCYSAVRSFF